MSLNSYNIFKTFFKVGTLLLGGGYVILPLLTNELVDKKKWITSEELCEFYAISTSLPGIIAINTAVFTGRKILGTKGAVAAIIGMILPAFLAIVLLASILHEIVDKPTVQHAFWGVGIGVITLLFLAIKEMWKKSVNDKLSYIIYTISLILALTQKVPLALIIIGSIIIAIICEKLKEKKEGELNE